MLCGLGGGRKSRTLGNQLLDGQPLPLPHDPSVWIKTLATEVTNVCLLYRLSLIISDHLTELLSLWKSNWFFRAHLQRARLTRLQDVMSEGIHITQILQIAVRVLKQLQYLHQRGLGQKQLEMEDIYVRMNKSVRFEVALLVRVK